MVNDTPSEHKHVFSIVTFLYEKNTTCLYHGIMLPSFTRAHLYTRLSCRSDVAIVLLLRIIDCSYL